MKKLIVCLALLFAACGADTEEAQSPTETDQAVATPASTMASCEDRTPPAPPKETAEGKTKPDVEIPAGAPPCKLVIQDIYVGTGAEARAGDNVTTHYVGVSWSTGDEFDSSWDGGQPVPFSLNEVIQGWQDGIPGMKEGGRRRLIIPPGLAYGPQPDPRSGIAPNETLVFVVDLVKAG